MTGHPHCENDQTDPLFRSAAPRRESRSHQRGQNERHSDRAKEEREIEALDLQTEEIRAHARLSPRLTASRTRGSRGDGRRGAARTRR